MFHCLLNSAWAQGNLAEVAGQLGMIVEHKVNPTRSQLTWDTLYTGGPGGNILIQPTPCDRTQAPPCIHRETGKNVDENGVSLFDIQPRNRRHPTSQIDNI